MTIDTRPVVVGIDGSDAAIGAALWAVDEAADRDVPLRLVHATGAPHPSSAPYAANDIAFEYGEAALRSASSAVADVGVPVKIETEIFWETAEESLIAESRDAAMVCVASTGIGWIAEKVVGSTATALARDADCPVAIVRYPPRSPKPRQNRWIVVGVDDRRGTDDLVARALDEARLRNASLLAVATWSSLLGGVSYAELDNRCLAWSRDHPDVHIRPAATGGGLPEYLVTIRERAIELVVIRAADAEQVPRIIGPRTRPILPYGQCSVMVVH